MKTALQDSCSAPLSPTYGDDSDVATLYLAQAEGPGRTPSRVLFYEERLVRRAPAPEPEKGGWRILPALRHRFERLSMELFAADRFVRRLEKYRKVRVFLNRSMDPPDVHQWLLHVIRDNSHHHLRWLFLDLLLLPISVFAAFLPGPNIWGYYLLFRVYSHWRAYRAASRVSIVEVDARVSEFACEVARILDRSENVLQGLHQLRGVYGLRAVQEHMFVPQIQSLRLAWHRFRERGGEGESG
jgi:hypothetical protein